MTPSEKTKMWVDYVKQAPKGYTPNYLASVYKAEGREVTSAVIKALGLALSIDLVEKHFKDGW